MAGIIFFATKNLKSIADFYINTLDMKVWLRQRDCVILRHGNFLIGFCERDRVDNSGIITLFLRDREKVDEYYDKLSHIALGPPEVNEKYNIYHFFARDPEGRLIEIQCFLHDIEPHLMGDELLVTRRSIRDFMDKEVPEEVLWKVFELCRWSPTSKNSQSYYFIVIRNRNVIKKLASLRGINSAPIGKAPIAVAICSDPNKSKRYVQDACIAAYHFMLACWSYGLGTCWIAAMDRDDVKDMLNIPHNHYIATITPVGYPRYIPNPPPRKPVNYFVKFFD